MDASLSLASRLAHAEAYPFPQPNHEWLVFWQGECQPADAHHPAVQALSRQSYHAVLASGSNASPVRLLQKFAVQSRPIVLRAVIVSGYVSAYSAHFATYGSIPATLLDVPAAQTLAFVTYLDDHDLRRMHESEAIGRNYDYAPVRPGSAIGFDGRVAHVDGYYRSLKGPLTIDGRAIRLAAIVSTGSASPSMAQAALLKSVASRLAPDVHYPDFMQRILTDPAFRADCTRRLGLGL